MGRRDESAPYDFRYAKKLKAPKLSRPEYVAVLVKNGCVGLAAELARLWRVPCPVFP